ncbi:MAG: phosphodiester glycosidase family protein [Candidatus Nanoarchaeia archaeon]|jgi:hypothetical protein|nr:phosphodiester glycosidase family protein [Candidatus Nanoarchaeia archaeon]|tara:strand:- start:3229 stop:4182 length:954 start_codon:yes stop_codon:yes gene_type:complete
MKNISRNTFNLGLVGAIGLFSFDAALPNLLSSSNTLTTRKRIIKPPKFTKVPKLGGKIEFDELKFEEFEEGLEFSRINIYNDKELSDIVSAVRVNPKKHTLKVSSGYKNSKEVFVRDIEEWQEYLKAPIVFNSAQYMAEPWGRPVARLISKGKNIGPRRNRSSRGMLVGDPLEKRLPEIDLLDYEYDGYPNKIRYNEAVEHWMILLDGKGKIRVRESGWQANRTVVAKDKKSRFLVFTTEGGLFTLNKFGKFLSESKLGIETAMNMDGGYEACLAINTKNLEYVTYGQFETYGPNKNVSILNAKIKIPTVVGVYPKN